MREYSVLILVCFVFTGSCQETLDGHKVICVTPRTELQLRTLSGLLSRREALDVWKSPSAVNRSVDIRLAPLEYDDVTNTLQQLGFHVTIMIENVQKILDEQKAARLTKGYQDGTFNYSRYHTMEDINKWMFDLEKTYIGMVRIFYVTKTYEGRQMMGIKISTKSPSVSRPAFWIQGGIHAREWISPATVIYMAGQMLEKYKSDPKLKAMVDNFDWYILPVTNPDGYAYTWTGGEARMWRKTRSKQGPNCIGVDPNRNWDWEWCKAGASQNPCIDIYCGPTQFSEVEIKGVAAFLSKIHNLKGFIDFHSYSQLWMSPWGYTASLPSDFKLQDAGSATAVKALYSRYGTQYQHGSIANVIYPASGSATDWVYGQLKVKFSYAVELRDGEQYGFLLPEDQIIPSGKETLDALIALAAFVHNK